QCPLCPRKRTWIGATGMSALCHKQTSHLTGASEFAGLILHSFIRRSRGPGSAEVTSVCPDLTHKRGLHRGRDAINDCETRPAAPSRDRLRWFVVDCCFGTVPIIRGPDVAGRIDHHVGEHLDGAAGEYVEDIAGLRAGRVSLRLGSGHQHYSTTPEISDPY